MRREGRDVTERELGGGKPWANGCVEEELAIEPRCVPVSVAFQKTHLCGCAQYNLSFGDRRKPSTRPLRSAPLSLDLADISHFTVTFDTSPVVLQRINETLRRDPMVVRWMLTKKGAAV